MSRLEKSTPDSFKALMDNYAILVGKEFGVQKSMAYMYWKKVERFPEIIIMSAFEKLAVSSKADKFPPIGLLISTCSQCLSDYEHEYYRQNPKEDPARNKREQSKPEVSKYFMDVIIRYFNGELTNKEYAEKCFEGFERFNILYSKNEWKRYFDNPDGRAKMFDADSIRRKTRRERTKNPEIPQNNPETGEN